MDLLVTACLFVLSAAVLVIGVMLAGIASDIRRTRQAVEKWGPGLPASAAEADRIDGAGSARGAVGARLYPPRSSRDERPHDGRLSEASQQRSPLPIRPIQVRS